MNYEAIIKRTEDFLETVPVKNFVISGKNLGEIMDEIQETYGYLVDKDPFFEGFIFNQMDIYEFSEYLKKIGFNTREEVEISYRVV